MLTDRFQSYVERYGLFTRDERVLLTVSGGVDSMVLLSLMAALGYRTSFSKGSATAAARRGW